MTSMAQWRQPMKTGGTLLLRALSALAPELSTANRRDDISESFPEHAMHLLADAGCLRAVLPRSRGGIGLGWKPEQTTTLLDLLRTIGGLHLSLARLFEGHVNAFRLLWTFGSPAQREVLCAYVADGGRLAVWNAPSPVAAMQLLEGQGKGLLLRGVKAYASGAGHIARPLVTAAHGTRGLLMVWPQAAYRVGPKDEWTVHGMRASVSRSIRYEDAPVSPDEIFGDADDYHRQPAFSAGAWRFLAAQLGAGEQLVELMREALLGAGRGGDPHQRARMAECAAAIESARLWVEQAAQRAEHATEADTDGVCAYVAIARVAVERFLLDTLERVQRSVGLHSFMRDSPIEQLLRDLATYLRQPAPDAARDAAGAYAFAHGRAESWSG